MKNKVLGIVAVLTLVCIVASSVSEVYGGCGGGGGGGGGCGGGGSTTSLSYYEKQALNNAIDEEYKARAIYRKVMNTFGPISPFYWIVRDEQRHVNCLANLLSKYGSPIPPDSWSGNVVMEFSTKQQACEVGAQAEFDNAAVYDQMIPGVSHTDIVSVFSKLRDVSRYSHLPAFLEWAAIYSAEGA